MIDKGAISVIESMQDKMHAILIGPGIGRDDRTKRAIASLLEKVKAPMIIDADALHMIDLNKVPEGTVITPHRGEFRALFGEHPPEDIAERKEMVMQKAKEYGITIVLKGPVDVISDGERAMLNRSGVPRMAVGGTGDVLAGVITSLIGRGMEPYHAARLGSFITGYAGEKAFAEKSYGMIATDVIEKIPEVLKEFL